MPASIEDVRDAPLQRLQRFDWRANFSDTTAFLRDGEFRVLAARRHLVDDVRKRAWLVSKDRGEVFKRGGSLQIFQYRQIETLRKSEGLQALLCVPCALHHIDISRIKDRREQHSLTLVLISRNAITNLPVSLLPVYQIALERTRLLDAEAPNWDRRSHTGSL
jgi:hypothetical protein